jgi:hypothetical protein
MSALAITVLAVLIGDQTVKLMLRRFLEGEALALGPCGVRVVPGRMWLTRLGPRWSGWILWCVWTVASISLVISSASAAIDSVFVGLLVGGSLSQAFESSLRGSITDYIRVRTRTFNLADLALAAGAIGTVGELVLVVQQRLA